MGLFRRLQPGVLVITTMAVIAAMFGSSVPNAQGFYVQNHERITRDALTPVGVDPATLNQILVGPPPGAGAVGSDAFFSDEFRHIDDAKNPAEICARSQEAWNFFTPIVLSGSAPVGPNGSGLANGPGARAAFGGLAHALQDFYSHSNWIEDNIAIGQLDRLAPPLMPTCDPATLPADLHTGFFSMDFSSDFPLAGCPPGGPPPGFADCHSTLNKDGWDTARGILAVPGANPPMNYFDLAAQLATRATTDLYGQVRGLVADKYGECAAANLFQVDRNQPCW
jgi:hypothetical protein